MEITRESIDALNAVLKIKVEPSDYLSKFEESLKKQRKQASMPGFRPGHVPMSVIKKKFGRSILAEELNTVLNESIHKHISENGLNVLGNPLPVEPFEEEGNWDNPSDFHFNYELGLAPAIELDKIKKLKVDYFKVKVDGKLIDRQSEDIRRRYGSLSEPSTSEDKDMLVGTLIELNESDEIKEGGIMNDATVSIEFIEDKSTKKALTGLRAEDSVVVDPHKISQNHDDLGKMLGISHAEVHHLKGNFKFNIKEIKRLALADVNQELFDKVYGKDSVKDESEFKAKIKEDLEKLFDNDSHRLFKQRVAGQLVESLKLSLPDKFLKKWIVVANEEPLTPEQVEAEYPGYAKGLQWQLIENAIVKEHDLKISQDEIMEFMKQNISRQYAQYGLPMDDEMLTNFAKNSLQNRDEVNRVYEVLVEDKVVDVLKSDMKINEKELSYDDFVKEAQKKA